MDNLSSLAASNLEKDSKDKNIVHKRRSSVFQSRTIVFDNDEDNGKMADDRDAVRCVSNVSQENVFNLEEYIINLRNERKAWIETLKRRKTLRKNLAKQKLCLENQGQPFDLNILTECEKAFIRDRPNYQFIYKNYKKLSDTVVKISVLHNLVYKLNEKFILQMERRLRKVTDKIIEKSDS